MNCACVKTYFEFFFLYSYFSFQFLLFPCLQTLFEISPKAFSGRSLSMKGISQFWTEFIGRKRNGTVEKGDRGFLCVNLLWNKFVYAFLFESRYQSHLSGCQLQRWDRPFKFVSIVRPQPKYLKLSWSWSSGAICMAWADDISHSYCDDGSNSIWKTQFELFEKRQEWRRRVAIQLLALISKSQNVYHKFQSEQLK